MIAASGAALALQGGVAAAQDTVESVLESGKLAEAYNPVLLNFLLHEGKDTLPEAQRKQAIDQLVTALKANLNITQGAETTAEIADLAGQILGGDIGSAVRGASYDIWDEWVDSADTLLAAGYKEDAVSFYESCAQKHHLGANISSRCALGLAKSDPAKAFEIVMEMAEQGNEGRKKTGLVNLGRLAASPDCPDEQKVAAIERLVKSTGGLDKATYGGAAVQGLIYTKDERAVEPLKNVAEGGMFSGAGEDTKQLAQRGLLLTFDDRSMVEKIAKKMKGGMMSTNTPADQFWAASILIQAGEEQGYEWALETLKKKQKGGMFSLGKKGEKDYFGDTLWLLVRTGGDRAKAVFTEAIEKGQGKDERKALLAIGLARIGDASQLERVKQALTQDKWGPAYRWQAAISLAKHDDYSGIPVLAELATAEKNKKLQIFPEDLRPDVAWALGEIDHADGVPILVGLLSDEDEAARRAAAYALLRMTDLAALDGLPAALGVDFGKVDGRSRNPQLWASLVRRSVAKFSGEEKAKAVCEKGAQSDYLSVKFLSLVAHKQLG